MKLQDVPRLWDSKTRLARHFSVIDAGAGPNFVHASKVPKDVVKSKIVVETKISEANGNLLKIGGSI